MRLRRYARTYYLIKYCTVLYTHISMRYASYYVPWVCVGSCNNSRSARRRFNYALHTRTRTRARVASSQVVFVDPPSPAPWLRVRLLLYYCYVINKYTLYECGNGSGSVLSCRCGAINACGRFGQIHVHTGQKQTVLIRLKTRTNLHFKKEYTQKTTPKRHAFIITS